jgi:formylglycine-generating enzyme required for sulfatase activity
MTPGTKPNAGTAGQGVTFTPDDTVNYNATNGTVSVTVTKAASSVTAWPTASAIVYGQALSNSVLSGGTATPAGTFAFMTPDVVLTAGVHNAELTFTPDDTVNYNATNGTVSVKVDGLTSEPAAGLIITGFERGSHLTFRAPEHGSMAHLYSVQHSTSLVLTAWTPAATMIGFEAAACVTSKLDAVTERMAFYRVVQTSNSADFVDGPYMAIDISGGPSAANYPVRYYASAADVPGGHTNDTYKTTNILLRLIPKGTFTMGSPLHESGRSTNETLHRVTLTKDFYMGVFEVTQRQWERVMGTWPAYFANATYRETRPVEQVSYYAIRENPANVDDPAVDWPSNASVNASSFIGQLRAKTGLAGLDLPTESQWEYACRAGTTMQLNSGKSLTSGDGCTNLDVLARYGRPSGAPADNTFSGTAPVGTYLPNAWGLYDMHGNVAEFCLDWLGTYPEPVTDPTGASSGTSRAARGGYWRYDANYCRSACRGLSGPGDSLGELGLRICITPAARD